MNAVMQAATPGHTDKQFVYDRLMEAAGGAQNDHLIASMLASLYASEGGMPCRLGLEPDDYKLMMAAHFPGVRLPGLAAEPGGGFAERSEEAQELSKLLLSHGVDDSKETAWMATIIVAGCMGGNHLWQDLGLWSRKDLSALIQANFPRLAAKNDKDMKWKKFFYKQLCIAEGIYVCRSPSCEVCPDYSDCFAAEE